jgi:hypothetical protein
LSSGSSAGSIACLSLRRPSELLLLALAILRAIVSSGLAASSGVSVVAGIGTKCRRSGAGSFAVTFSPPNMPLPVRPPVMTVGAK